MSRRTRRIVYWAAVAIGAAGCVGPHPTREAPRETLAELTAPSENRMLAIAQQLERSGEAADAAKMYEAVLRDDPGQTAARHRLGVLVAQCGDLAEGERHLRLALESDAANVELLSDIGYCCYLQKRYNDAESLYRPRWSSTPLTSPRATTWHWCKAHENRLRKRSSPCRR